MTRNTTTTGWVGWAYFAAVMLLAVGGMQIVAGLVSIFNENYYIVTSSGLIAFDYATWGWMYLLIGSIALLTGFGLLTGSAFARVVAVIIAVIAMIGNVAFLSAYPLWSIIALIVNGLIIYSLTIHGSELEA